MIRDLQSGLKVAVRQRIKRMSRRVKRRTMGGCFKGSTGSNFLLGGSGGSGGFLRGPLP